MRDTGSSPTLSAPPAFGNHQVKRQIGPGPWLAVPRPNPLAGLRLFGFPYAGGGASLFRHWPERLPASVEVCPVQLPGREARLSEPGFDRLTPLVETLARELRPHFDRPFAFFGHSLGALVGFELARQLRRSGGPQPVCLFASGRRAPQIPNLDPPIHDLPEPAFRAELRRFSGTPPAVLDHDELMALVLPRLRADFALSETYVYTPEPAFAFPVFALGGLEDPRVERPQLEAWREHTTGPFQLRMLPGNHFFLHSAEDRVLEILGGELPRLVDPAAVAWLPPSGSLTLLRDEVHVWRATLDRSEAEIRELRQTLTADEQRRADRFVFEKDRIHFTAGRGILRALLAAYLGHDPRALRFTYNLQGKPALAGETGPAAPRFNLSHSHGLALFALAWDRELGVDLEWMRPDFASEEIAERFFSPQEVAVLRKVPLGQRPEAFFACWSRKEAYIKARGMGLSIPLDQFDVTLAPGEPACLLATREDPAQLGRWSMVSLPPAPGFQGALAVEGHGWRLRCWQWPEDPRREGEIA
jgi:phosphopantetheine--protein transferase-like protein